MSLSLPEPFRLVRLYEAEIKYEIEDELLRVGVEIAVLDGDGKRLDEIAMPRLVSFPLTWFHDEHGQLNALRVQQYCTRLNWMIETSLDQAVFHDYAFHVLHCAQMLAAKMRIGSHSPEEIARGLATLHTNSVMERLHSMMGQQTGDGRYSRWTAESLSLAIVVAMQTIKNPERRSYTTVARVLHQLVPRRFKSGTRAALIKLVTRYGLDWDDLKMTATLSDADMLSKVAPAFARFLPEGGTDAHNS